MIMEECDGGLARIVGAMVQCFNNGNIQWLVMLPLWCVVLENDTTGRALQIVADAAGITVLLDSMKHHGLSSDEISPCMVSW